MDKLEELMKDFHAAPATDDGNDLFRCVTTEALASNKELGTARTARKQDAEAAKKDRERRERETAMVAYRLDYDWKTRKTPAQPAVSACWNNCCGGEWEPYDMETCERAGRTWRVKRPPQPAVFAYSGTDTQPTDPPELMRRIASHKVTVPERFACRVVDVVSSKTQRMVQCGGSSRPMIRLSGNALAINVGDEISVPLAETHRDPEGVLLRVAERGEARWTVDAEGATVKLDAPAKCPTVEEIVASVKSKK